MRLRLIVNPAAGAGDAAALLPAVETRLKSAGISAQVHKTQGPLDATRLVREAIAERADGIALIGGDGTFNEAINGLFDAHGEPTPSETWLSFLSAGTGGDFRKTAKLPTDPDAFVRAISEGTTRAIDCGWLTFRDHQGLPGGRAYLNVASFGMGGVVDKLANESPKWMGGRLTFLWASLRAMASYELQPVRITLDDGTPRETRVVNIVVANGQFFGGGMHIAPRAELDDGLFDVVGLENLSRAGQLALSPALYGGTLLERKGITFARAKKIVAEPLGETPVLLDVDGETPGSLPATFTIREGALRLRC